MDFWQPYCYGTRVSKFVYMRVILAVHYKNLKNSRKECSIITEKLFFVIPMSMQETRLHTFSRYLVIALLSFS